MKRIWIGIGLLVGLFILGLWSMYATDAVHSTIADQLQQSSEAARNGQWEQADRLIQSASAQWEERWNFTASMTDHTALDDIDALFAQAQVYRKSREPVAYAAACARLAQLIEALQEGHQLTWWNLL